MPKYTEAQQAEVLSVLRSNNGNILKTSRDCGVPFATVHRWAQGVSLSADVPTKVIVAEEKLADILERHVRKILTVVDDKLEGASYAAAMTGLGIGVEKIRLLKDQTTSNVGFSATPTPTELAGRLREVFNHPNSRAVRLLSSSSDARKVSAEVPPN